jgi:hypothetical protein
MNEHTQEKYAALAEKDRQSITDMIDVAVAALSTENGALVLLVDVEGQGVAQMLAAGNQLLVEPLLRSADAVCDRVFSNHAGVLQ